MVPIHLPQKLTLMALPGNTLMLSFRQMKSTRLGPLPATTQRHNCRGAKLVKRAGNTALMYAYNMGVNHGCTDIVVAE